MNDEAPIRIAVIGAGPAGFYAAGHLLKDSGGRIEVDMLERLPTPWGLVRSGVAPDHPKIKSVTRIYEKTAGHERFRYFGNVELGRHVSREELLEHYHALVYATGAPTDRPLGIPGEELPGSWPATEFVGWYNAHPDHPDLDFDLSCERAVVIGNGNVALDVARMLTLSQAELAGTDTADHALEALARSAIREVVVVGRRGPAQAAFTNPELRELADLAEADVVVDGAELERALAVPEPYASATAKQNVELLRGYARRAEAAGGAAQSDTADGDSARPGRAAADRAALPALPGRDPRRRGRPRDGGDAGPQRARRGLRRSLARGGDGRAGADPGGLGAARDRLPRLGAPGRAVRRVARGDPQRGRARPGGARGRCPASTRSAGSSAARRG